MPTTTWLCVVAKTILMQYSSANPWVMIPSFHCAMNMGSSMIILIIIQTTTTRTSIKAWTFILFRMMNGKPVPWRTLLFRICRTISSLSSAFWFLVVPCLLINTNWSPCLTIARRGTCSVLYVLKRIICIWLCKWWSITRMIPQSPHVKRQIVLKRWLQRMKQNYLRSSTRSWRSTKMAKEKLSLKNLSAILETVGTKRIYWNGDVMLYILPSIPYSLFTEILIRKPIADFIKKYETIKFWIFTSVGKNFILRILNWPLLPIPLLSRSWWGLIRCIGMADISSFSYSIKAIQSLYTIYVTYVIISTLLKSYAFTTSSLIIWQTLIRTS